jgi:hypothetical protein
VQRPQGGGDELAARILTGGVDVVAVVGPVGSGKSTELAHAASLLQQQFVVALVPLDRLLDMRRVTEEEVFVQVARAVEGTASGAHFHFVRAVPVRPDQEPEAPVGRQFLCDIVGFRLGYNPSGVLDVVLDRAAPWSGGLPRSFLQLVQATGSYAALSGRGVFTRTDLQAAVRDQGESLARLLEKGDLDRLRDADGKSEREIPRDDRVRLLMQGLLLEYKTAQQGAVVHPAPLLQDLLARPAP